MSINVRRLTLMTLKLGLKELKTNIKNNLEHSNKNVWIWVKSKTSTKKKSNFMTTKLPITRNSKLTWSNCQKPKMIRIKNYKLRMSNCKVKYMILKSRNKRKLKKANVNMKIDIRNAQLKNYRKPSKNCKLNLTNPSLITNYKFWNIKRKSLKISNKLNLYPIKSQVI